jgi:hypothetical protein
MTPKGVGKTVREVVTPCPGAWRRLPARAHPLCEDEWAQKGPQGPLEEDGEPEFP